MILLDSSYGSWESDVLFLKIEAGVLDLWFDTSLQKTFGSNSPKPVFRPQTPNVTFGIYLYIFFMSSSIKFCMKQGLIFKFWVIFDKVMSVSRVIFHVKLHNPPHLTPMDFAEILSGGYPSKIESPENLRLKCSFLSLVQVNPRVQVTPFYGTLSNQDFAGLDKLD